MKTEYGGPCEASGKLSNWVVGGYVVLVLVPAWLCVGYAVLAPAKADEGVTIASRFDVGEAAYIHQAGGNVIDGRVFVRLWSGEEVP